MTERGNLKIIEIKDRWLKKAIIEQTGENITPASLAEVKEIDWNEYRAEADMEWGQIKNLDGLEYCKNIEILSLDGNNISSLDPLAGLDSVEEIWLVQNSITNIEGIKGNKNIKKLVLDMNYKLEDISPVIGMDSLIYLNINETSVSDISSLGSLNSIEELSMNSTKVTDLSPLEGLTNLKRLAVNWLNADLSPGSRNREILLSLVKNGTDVYSNIRDELIEEAGK